ncbi:hypothetical protein HY29_11740 [Hyphomonas beringensis]|uniref:DUF6249 domain-containing protein n=1 Tax=Hyphomonas beringensis TaxID=1280946 RepID=A0A062U5H9_9PROT|nr:DUF6249 domain-containing protein [Hyphomonas beringensis]KCZ55581.1 hypothetical protein HY29_11740 [Hyphomonas beringensis]
MEDIIVPIGLCATIVGIVWLVSHFNFKKRKTIHETVRDAIDKGQVLDREMIERLALVTDPVRADLRRGVLFLAVGIAFGFLGVMVGSEQGEAIKPMIGVASFPVFLGLAYLGLWAFGRRETA